MKTNYLFPSKYKKIGLIFFIPSFILGLTSMFFEYEPSFLDFKMPSFFLDKCFYEASLFLEKGIFGFEKDNILNEILGVILIVSSILLAFSKEKIEDEFISKIRLESLAWAVYLNYAVLLFSFLFLYGFSFLLILEFNMFTVLIFFICRFNWKLRKLRKL